MTPKTEQLPVRTFKKAILDTVAEHNVSIIIGETGSGKTTQIAQVLDCWASVQCPRQVYSTSLDQNTLAATSLPLQMLDEAGLTKEGRVGVTQPRRVVSTGHFPLV